MDTNKYEKLADDVKDYARMRYDLLRLEILEKSSQIISLLVVIIICVVLCLAAFVYFTFALVVLLEPCFGSMIPPLCIVGGFFVLLVALILLFRKHLFLNPLIDMLSKILFKKDSLPNNEKEDEYGNE